jgi:RNA polymerase sigma-70 factor, ECF subfamily
MSDIDERAEIAVSRYRGHIHAYCVRRLPASHAGDATSEVMTITWRRRATLPEEPGTLPWMYGVAHKVVGGVRRSERRWLARAERAAATAITHSDPVESGAIQMEEERQVRQALSRLRSADQEILRLAAWEGLTNRQIAEIMGLTPAAADQRLSRAKKRLAEAFNDIASGRGVVR